MLVHKALHVRSQGPPSHIHACSQGLPAALTVHHAPLPAWHGSLHAHPRAVLQHGANLVLLLVEFAMNQMPYEPYLLGWTGLYSSAYALWAFSYYKATNRWMYPVGPSAACVVAKGAAAHLLPGFCYCPALSRELGLRADAVQSGLTHSAAEGWQVQQLGLYG